MSPPSTADHAMGPPGSGCRDFRSAYPKPAIETNRPSATNVEMTSMPVSLFFGKGLHRAANDKRVARSERISREREFHEHKDSDCVLAISGHRCSPCRMGRRVSAARRVLALSLRGSRHAVGRGTFELSAAYHGPHQVGWWPLGGIRFCHGCDFARAIPPRSTLGTLGSSGIATCSAWRDRKRDEASHSQDIGKATA